VFESLVRIASIGIARCGIANEGRLLCTGFDDDLFWPIAEHRDDPPVAVTEGAVELAFGRHHACARITDGSVRCWGRNDLGQVDGEPARSERPVRVDGLGAP